jgi:hypothetical protein
MSRFIDNILADYTGAEKCLTLNDTMGTSSVLPPGHVWTTHPGYGTPVKSPARRAKRNGKKAIGISGGKA